MHLADKNEAEVVIAVERRLSRLSAQTRTMVITAWLEGSNVLEKIDKPAACSLKLQEALTRIQQLEGALGRKTLENELLQEAVNANK
jgi:transposase